MVEKTTEMSSRQRQILKELENCDDEMTGQQLHRVLHDRAISMGLTTVYRHLRVLQQKGLVRCRNLPTGEVLYTPVDRDNHHLTCVDCGQTMALKFCPLGNIELPSDQTKNFQMLFHTLEFFGRCKNCCQRQQPN